ncbi:MAG: hypothetical protein O2798_06435 [Chloroflexi bacterium]|nr:hypothetical protein [Chloroflexota bacterium]MDA1240468.1 hypothetical protein [Chloroflexota bacterium]
MKFMLAAMGGIFVSIASLTVLPIVIAFLGGLVMTATGAGATLWRYQRRRARAEAARQG